MKVSAAAIRNAGLLLFVPLSLALHRFNLVEPHWVFLSGLVAIAVLADWMRRATEQLAEHAGSAIGSLLNATSYFSDPSIDFPRAVAADPNGNILIANYANSSATIYNGSGQLIKSNVASNSAALPVAIAP